MTKWWHVWAPGIACAVLTFAAAGGDPARLEAEFDRLEEFSGGTMGIAAIHLESGEAAYLNADEAFPMASSYKVAIAAQLLHRVDNGKLKLTKMVKVEPSDLSPGSGTISQLFNDPGLSISILNLLELMLLISDNSATDLCLELAGGGEAVTTRMHELGIQGLRVDRPTLGLIADVVGVKDLPKRKDLTLDTFRQRLEAVPDEEQKAAGAAFAADPRDTCTPHAMGELLRLIWTDKALSAENSARLRDIMTRCETGEARIKGLLPAGTVVAHKTGTIGGTTNDVGVITLPNERGHVIFAAFVKNSTREVPEREKAIAECARAAHDYFLFAGE